MKKRILFLITIIMVVQAQAQQFPSLSQYMLNPLYFNPAYTGDGELFTISVLHRAQWAGYTDYEGNSVAPQLQLLSGLANIDKTGHSIGFLLGHDKAGLLTNVQAKASYAYRIKFAPERSLSFGVRTGIDSRSVNFSQHIIKDPDDPLIPGQKQRETRPDLDLGAWFDQQNFFAGFSAKNLLGNHYSTPGLSVTPSYILTGGLHLQPSMEMKITPSFQVITSAGDVAFDVSTLCNYADKLFAGLSYRHQQSVAALAGLSFLETKLRLHYSFEYVTYNKQVVSSTSNEIMLRYRTGEWKQGGRKARLKKSKARRPSKPIMIIKDKDKDGVPDDEDKCIDEPGRKELDGCPDRDHDGIVDNEDLCPDVPGLKLYSGCPDTDEDGIIDGEDDCPEVPGDAEHKGCPISFTEETLGHITFETGKATLIESSYVYLDQVITILKEYNRTRVIIEGHTDSEGDNVFNLELSRQRAETIQQYFIKNGIRADRLSVSGFGETKPIDTNDTPEGRRRNRRVEIHFMKEKTLKK